jgi:hypothetical protein
MEILVEKTASFDADLMLLSDKERSMVTEKLNFLVSTIMEKGNTKQLYRLQKLQLPNNLSSSLFIFRIDTQLRAIVTFEQDPLFNQSVLTLIRLIKHTDLDKTFNAVSEALYQDMFNSNNRFYGRN